MSGQTAVRKLAKGLVARLPLGLGRIVRERDALRCQLRDRDAKLAGYEETLEAARKRGDDLRAESQLAQQNAKTFGYAYRRLLAAVDGLEPDQVGPASVTAPDTHRSMADRDRARAVHSRASIVDLLESGCPLDDAVLSYLRATLDGGHVAAARTLAEALQADPGTRDLGHLGAALVAQRSGLNEVAWRCFQAAPRDLRRRHALGEYAGAAFGADRDAAVEEVRALVADPPLDVPARSWLGLVHAAFGAGEVRLAGQVFEVIETLAGEAPHAWSDTERDRDWLRPWLDKAIRAPQPTRPSSDGIAIALLDLGQPDRSHSSASSNDYLQLLAALAHVARHQNARLHGPEDLQAVLSELRQRVRPELRLDSAAADVTLVPAHRDASHYDEIPEGTWTLAVGPYLQSIFGRYDFPLHPNLLPLFCSFRCEHPEMLTPDGIAYLRDHGPVGCQDWTTVDLLLEAGVPAFFTGSVAATLHLVFPEGVDDGGAPGRDAPRLYVGVGHAPAGAETLAESLAEWLAGRLAGPADDLRGADLATNLRAALDLLERYRSYSAVVTSLPYHYLAARSIGVEVDFRPDKAHNLAFRGSFDLSDADFAGMQQALSDKVAAVLEVILSGQDTADVYARWREVCANDVARAQSRAEQARTESTGDTLPAWSQWPILPTRPTGPVGSAGRSKPRRRWAIKTSTPDPTARWGDWHFACAVRDALVELGEDVRVDTHPVWHHPRAELADVNLVLRGRYRFQPKPGSLNLLWVISHPDHVRWPELRQFDAVLVASETYAATLTARWPDLSARPLLQCTDPARFRPEPDASMCEDLLFVGNSRRILRTIVRDAIAAGLHPAVYGAGWEELIPAEFIRGTHIPNEQLNRYYSSAGVVLNDHWSDMLDGGFVSNRLFDAVACGARVVTDDVGRVDHLFGDRVVVYHSPDELVQAVEKARALPAGAPDTVARLAQEHSFAARAHELVAVVDELMAGHFDRPREGAR